MSYELPTVEILAPVSVFQDPFFNEALKPDDQIDWRIRKLKQFIENGKGNTAWDLNKICEHLSLHISGNYAAQLFRQSIGMGWREYAARYRLASVAEKLKTTSDLLDVMWPEEERAARSYGKRKTDQ
jgi:AraC-like DNA-binding protein